jgi:hypothetical protein
MTKFIPLVDTNTKQVLQWTMVDDSGSETIISITKIQWKPVSSWTEEELHKLFNITTIVEAEEELEAVEEAIEYSVIEPLVLITEDTANEKKDF